MTRAEQRQLRRHRSKPLPSLQRRLFSVSSQYQRQPHAGTTRRCHATPTQSVAAVSTVTPMVVPTLQRPVAADSSVEDYLIRLEQLVLQLNMELGRRDQANSDRFKIFRNESSIST